MSISGNLLYIMETVEKNLMAMDLSTNSITWKADQLTGTSYTAPIKVGNSLIVIDNTDKIYSYNTLDMSTTPNIASIKSGTYSNIVSEGNNIYYIDMKGILNRVNVSNISQQYIISKVDSQPEADAYLAKRLIRAGSNYYFSSDVGKLFNYNSKTGKSEFIVIPGIKSGSSLVGTPSIIGDTIIMVDNQSNVYKKYEKLM